MTPEEMKQRTKQFGIRVIRVVESLPASRVCNIIGGQLLRAGTSVGSNYRAACRARSQAEFIAKLGIVEKEADEILSIVVASSNTARGGRRRPTRKSAIRNPQSAIGKSAIRNPQSAMAPPSTPTSEQNTNG